MAPRIERLSQHQATAGSTQSIYVYGEGFQDVIGVAFGEQWCLDFRVDGTTVITATPPPIEAGTSVWVVVYTQNDGTSPCEGDAQTYSVLAADAPPVGSELRLDSIVPDEITVGRPDPYWLMGKGLSGASGVILGSSACQFECYDDERLVLWVPETVHGVTGDQQNVLTVTTAAAVAELPVMCRTVLVDPGNSGRFPTVLELRPDHLGPDGGALAIGGDSFHGVVRAFLGDVELEDLEVLTATEIRARVPRLDRYVGQDLMPLLLTGDETSPNTDLRLRVTDS